MVDRYFGELVEGWKLGSRFLKCVLGGVFIAVGIASWIITVASGRAWFEPSQRRGAARRGSEMKAARRPKSPRRLGAS